MINAIIEFFNAFTIIASVVLVFWYGLPWSLLVIPPFYLWWKWAEKKVEEEQEIFRKETRERWEARFKETKK